MMLAFLSSILASSTNGYSCLFLLEERVWPRSLLLWGLLGVMEGKRLQSALVPLPIQHTPESQHFSHRPLHCQSPALPGTLRFQDNEKYLLPSSKEEWDPGMKGQYARPSVQALPMFNSTINTPQIYIPCFLQPTVGAVLLTYAKHHWALGMHSWMCVAGLLKVIVAFL